MVFDGHCLHGMIGGNRTQFLQVAHQVLKPTGILAIHSMGNDVPDSDRHPL
ncbi:MAG: hypothetical protein AAF327_01160 [Cyanobacteria bacterium P01_A01_bin.37]